MCYHDKKLTTAHVFSRLAAAKLVNLKTMDKITGWFFLLHYSLGKHSMVKPFKQLEVAKSTRRGSWESGGMRSHRKTTCKWTVCSDVHHWKMKKKQFVNACERTMVESARQKLQTSWEFTRFMFRECLNLKYYWNEKVPKWKSTRRPKTCRRSIRSSYDLGGFKAINHMWPGWWVLFHKKIGHWRDFLDFPTGEVPGLLWNQANSEKHRRWLQEKEVTLREGKNVRKLTLVGIVPNQILFSFSSDKDRRTDNRIRRKNTAQPRRESNPGSCEF